MIRFINDEIKPGPRYGNDNIIGLAAICIKDVMDLLPYIYKYNKEKRFIQVDFT